MLAIGTKPEYFNAVWVKNEWSRYLKIIAKDRFKLLIPCYRDMDAYELPEEFAHLQAQDMGKIGFINDVVRGIQKVIKKDEFQPIVIKETIATSHTNTNIETLLKRAFMFLEDGEWDRADDFCEQVLNIDPENVQAYLGKLMAELYVKKQEGLKDCTNPFDGFNNYQKIIRFATPELKSEVEGYITYINERNENERKEKIYAEALSILNSECKEKQYYFAAEYFRSIADYKDSAKLADKCIEKADEVHKDGYYKSAKERMASGGIRNYENAISDLSNIPGWRDSDELILVCKKRIEELRAKIEADRLERERKVELAQQEYKRISRRNKIIAFIVTALACAIIAIIIFINSPGSKYNKAIALMDNGDISKAYEIFVELDGYKDSTEQADAIYRKANIEKLKEAKVNDYVFFGSYEQDDDISNGKEDIEWLVLDVVEERVLLISKYALDSKLFNATDGGVTWETSTIREWLNNDFYNDAFSDDEKAVIPTVMVSADENPSYKYGYVGNDTQDKVFLLSYLEAKNYFSSSRARVCVSTTYAERKGATKTSSSNMCPWWLRTSGSTQNSAACVLSSGDMSASGRIASEFSRGVRPAMWIDLNAE